MKTRHWYGKAMLCSLCGKPCGCCEPGRFAVMLSAALMSVSSLALADAKAGRNVMVGCLYLQVWGQRLEPLLQGTRCMLGFLAGSVS